jgi:hypothetical protein
VEPGESDASGAGAGPGPGDGPGEVTRRRWFRRPGVVVPIGLVALAAAVGAAFFLRAWNERGADEASVDRSVEGFREDQAGDGSVGLLRPAAGVYTYAAQGTEQLSLLGTTQAWGDQVPATVTIVEGPAGTEGCWTIRFEFSTNHTQATTYCADERVLEEVTGSTSQTFDFVATQVTDVTEFRCDPPGQLVKLDAEPGESWEQSCQGTSPERGTTVTSAGTNTFLGVEPVEVGDEAVDALHYRVDRTLSGDQDGIESTEYWFDPRTALPLQAVRAITVASPSPLGDITYTEEGRYRLTSLTPRT